LLRIRGISVGSRADLRSVLCAMETRRIHPVIDREFAFDEVGTHCVISSGCHFGKLLSVPLERPNRVRPSAPRP